MSDKLPYEILRAIHKRSALRSRAQEYSNSKPFVHDVSARRNLDATNPARRACLQTLFSTPASFLRVA
jgi:hypothetical protein